jgi:hypothetical protein
MKSNRFYVDINSAYRNRLSYPLVGNFVVEVNTNYSNTPKSSADPILLAFPYETNLCQGGSTLTQIALSVSSQNIIDYYKDSYLEIGGIYRLVTAYDPTTQIATVGIPFPVAPAALTPYTIRKELPILINSTSYIDTTPLPAPTGNQIVIGPLTSVNPTQYINNWVFVPGSTPPATYQWYRIEEVISGLQSITVTAPGGAYLFPPEVVITGDGTGATARAVIVANAVTSIVITNPGRNYTFANISIVGGGGAGATAIANIATMFTVAGQFTPLIGAGEVYQLLRFSYNNVVPLTYQKTNIFNNASNLEIKLINLVVPNQRVRGGYGGTLQNYPYLYVALYPESGCTYNNVIISNMPQRDKALFKVPVTYLQNNSFLTLSSTAMTQVISLKENEPLRFSVFLPNGDVLDFEPFNQFTQFSNWPVISDPFTQITAVFEIVHL